MSKRRLSNRERDYLLRWQRVGPLLDSIRHDELRRQTEEDYLRTMEDLWSVEVQPEVRTTSGLVEWQRLLRKHAARQPEVATVSNESICRILSDKRRPTKQTENVMSNPQSTNAHFEFGVGHDFANAVLYSLSDNSKAEHTSRGILVPINEEVWQDVFHRVFPQLYDGENMQKLAAYCSYYRLGKHGIGYDRKGLRDFARGARKTVKDRGKWGLDVSSDPSRAIWPSKGVLLPAAVVIRIAKEYLRSHHPDAPEVEKQLARASTAAERDHELALSDLIRDPIRREMFIEAYERRASWARLARRLYGYDCMVVGCDFALLKDDGEQYIEVHHITPMFEGGSPNDKHNLSVLCPNWTAPGL